MRVGAGIQGLPGEVVTWLAMLPKGEHVSLIKLESLNFEEYSGVAMWASAL